MDKQNARLYGTTVVITAAIIGGAYLLDRAYQSAQPGESRESGWTPLSTRHPAPNNNRHPGPQNNRHPGPEPGSSTPSTTPNGAAQKTPTDQIITCTHPQYGTVYTNAPSCEEADWDNRISIAEPLHQTPGQDRYSGKGYQTPENEAGNSRTNRKEKNQKPNLRLHGKSPPSGLNVSCKNSVGKALEIERDLAATSNPRESAWRDSYCKQRCEAIQESCPVRDDYFYYRFNSVCPGSEHYPCYAENS